MPQALVVPVDELGRRHRRLVAGEQRPAVVVQVEHGRHRDEVLVGVEEGVHGTHVTPVVAVALGGTGNVVVLEVVDAGGAPVHEPGHDAAAHIVLGGLVGGVHRDGLQERVGVHDVVAHRGQDLIRGVRQARGVLGLLDEGLDPAAVGRVGLDDAELVRQ